MPRRGLTVNNETGELLNLWFEALVGHVGAGKDMIWDRINQGQWDNPEQARLALDTYTHLTKALATLQEPLRQLHLPETLL